MATENQNNPSPFSKLVSVLIGILAPKVIEFGESELEKLLHSKRTEIVEAAVPVTPDDIHKCDQGQHWSDSLNKCVDDIG